MPDWSRRRALHALGTATAVALAGCSSSDDDGFEEPPGGGRGDRVTDYELRTVRASAAEPVFWKGERPADGEPSVGGHAYVATEDDLADVSFGDGGPAEELEAFVRATDYGSESALLQQRPVRECYDLRFRGVWREDDGFQTSFCSYLRPADVACSSGDRQTVAVAIRFPFVEDDVTSMGSSWSSSCDRRPDPVVADSGGDES
ncbi:uncharacterized protein HHUB_2509 [Halobacterium hubeiense]|uniref:Lipoprotein n=1 Tax=Halobacterium hubeiense TaxID=1407499 RepID=A0A0U5HUE6_9EURY|nr:hypothetical protein [Halobacterium hubeiense]CQH57287.1 uncharacterized protein HHUB_2509 [Halobacterium hubeiense]